MKTEITQRIEQIKNGEVPEGYHYSRAGLSPKDWGRGKLSDVLYNEQRVVLKPKEPYWRIGIRSHAKGTFHEYVENPETVNMDELYVVRENDLILNITFAWEHAVALADKNDDGLLVSHRFPTYVFREGQNPIFYKNIAIQKRFKEMLALISPGGAGRNRVMSKKDFLQLPCNIPSLKEQQKIAEILIQCDKVIELKKKRIEEEQRLKKALMQKTFNENNYSTLCWKSKKIKELGVTYSGLTGKSAEDFGYGKPYITYVNILKNNIVDKNLFEYVNVGENEKQNCVKYGDLFFTTSSETPEEVGMSASYLGDNVELYLNSFCFGFRLNSFNEIIPEFLSYYAQSSLMKKVLYKLAQGSTRYNLSKKYLVNEIIHFPAQVEEQKKIVSILKSQENKIVLLKQELNQWQQKKKSLMQLLLTGIVRCIRHE